MQSNQQAYVVGFVTDRERRFPITIASVICASDPRVMVITQKGHFWAPNLVVGQLYHFIVRVGKASIEHQVVPREPGLNQVDFAVDYQPPFAKAGKA